jgi:hypothetical protein
MLQKTQQGGSLAQRVYAEGCIRSEVSTMKSEMGLALGLAWSAVLVFLMMLVVSVASVAEAQTPFDHQYGSSAVSPGIAEKGGAVASVFTGVLPETGGVSYLVPGFLLVSVGTGLFFLGYPGRRSGRRDRQ